MLFHLGSRSGFEVRNTVDGRHYAHLDRVGVLTATNDLGINRSGVSREREREREREGVRST